MVFRQLLYRGVTDPGDRKKLKDHDREEHAKKKDEAAVELVRGTGSVEMESGKKDIASPLAGS